MHKDHDPSHGQNSGRETSDLTLPSNRVKLLRGNVGRPEMHSEQYLLAAFDPAEQDQLLMEIVQFLLPRADAKIVRMAADTRTKRVVAKLSPQALSELKAKYGQRLIAEVDAELRL